MPTRQDSQVREWYHWLMKCFCENICVYTNNIITARACILKDFFISRETGTLKLADFLAIPGIPNLSYFPGKQKKNGQKL